MQLRPPHSVSYLAPVSHLAGNPASDRPTVTPVYPVAKVNWVRSCKSCSRRKTPKHKVIAPLVKMTSAASPFERVSVDILGPLPVSSSGNQYVLCFTDHCTRWPILVPIKSTDARTVASCFYKEIIICNHGCPKFLLSDRGTNFLSKLMIEV